MTGYVDLSQAGVALGQNSTRYAALSSNAQNTISVYGNTGSDPCRITGLANPTQSSDACNLQYLQTYVMGQIQGMAVKEDCLMASTTQQSLSMVTTGPFTNLWSGPYATNINLAGSTSSNGMAWPAVPLGSAYTVAIRVSNLSAIGGNTTMFTLGGQDVRFANSGTNFNLELQTNAVGMQPAQLVVCNYKKVDLNLALPYYFYLSVNTVGGTTAFTLALFNDDRTPVTNTGTGMASPSYTGYSIVAGGYLYMYPPTSTAFSNVMLNSSEVVPLVPLYDATQPTYASAVIDGITLTSGMRVLLTGQTDAIQNGIYVVGTSSLARSSDLAVGALASGTFCFVTGGTVNGHKGFVCNALPGAETVGSHALQWTVFTSEDGKVGTTTIVGGVITDASGAISLVNNSLTTSGQITAGSQNVGTLRLASGTVYDTSGALSLGSTSVTTTGSVTANSVAAASHVAGTLSFAAASLTDSSGSISMSSTNLATAGSMSAAHFTSSSDERLKRDIKPLATTLEDLKKVRGVSFKWASTESADTGVIAQEIQMLAPECVHQDERSGYLQVDYARLVPYLIEWIRQLAAME